MNGNVNTKAWRTMIPEEEREIFNKSGFSDPLPMGKNPLLLVIDCTFAFTGSKPQSIEESIKEFPTSCGEMAWNAFPSIRRLLDTFRERNLKVVYTRCDYDAQRKVGKATKSRSPVNSHPRANDIADIIAPLTEEWVLDKPKASAFFSTSLNIYLQRENIDTLVVCGVSTSGCVRASVVDSFSHGFTTFVAEDGCFDRSFYSHCASLFDMNAKYATVLSSEEIAALIDAR